MAKMGRPPVENPKLKKLTFRMSDEFYAELKEYAEKHDLTMTDVALQALEEKLSKEK